MGSLYIWGWWQGNNLGDNWIKKTLSKVFPYAKFIDTTVTASLPDKDNFVICGGGGLFIYDVISPWYKTNYLTNNNINFGMIGLGAEFEHKTDVAQFLEKKSKFFFVRDQYSLDCMHLSNVERSYDITFASPLEFLSDSEINLDNLFFVWRDGKDLISNDLFKEYIKFGSSLEEYRKIIESHFENIVEDDFQTNEDDIEERIKGAGFVISGRFHGIVAAIQKGIPFIAIDICPKIRELTRDLGLEKYCVKISEVSKLDSLIKEAKSELQQIRLKEKQYCEIANHKLSEQIDIAKLEILKVISPLNIVHYGSYWMGDNDVVNVMSDDLSNLCSLKKVDLKAYAKEYDKRIISYEKTPNGSLCCLGMNECLPDLEGKDIDAIILNSGGLYLNSELKNFCKKRSITTIGISLSDPDVFPYNGKRYASDFDIFYTNSKYSYLNEYDHSKVNIHMLPFAASVKHHYYNPAIERKYDVVIVGHARQERIALVDKLEKICSVGTYGAGWKNSLGVVNGKKHVDAINSGRMYISFSKTVAGFNNVKVGLFEAIACKQVVFTEYMEELADYFEINKEVICFNDYDDLLEKVKYYLEHSDELEEIREASYKKFLQCHTYEKRWHSVLKELYKRKNLF